MDSEMIAAAILAAGYATAQRQAISGGALETSLKEQYIEFLAFLREQNKPPAKPASKKKKKK